MALNYCQISGTFEGGDGSPLSGTVTFTPSASVRAGAIPLLSVSNPVQCAIVNGALKTLSGGTVQLLATDNTGLTIIGSSGWWYWQVSVTIAGQVQPSWGFFLPYSSSPVDLYALAGQTLAQFPNPMTQAGDTIIGGASGTPERLAGNATAAREFLISQGTGTMAQPPSWAALAAGDIPPLPYARLLTPTAVKTSAYGAAAGDYVPCDTTSAGFTVTLPAAPADLSVVGVKQVIQGGMSTVTVAAGLVEDIRPGGGTSLALTLLNQGALLQYRASGGIWYVLADDLALPQLDGRYAQIGTAGWLILALPALVFTAITRNGNEAVTSASVLWPDGSPGTWTTDTLSSAFPGAVDAYHVSYGSPTVRTVTQPAVTRDAAGAVTVQPAITVT
jgi:hypothetical protein